MSLNRFAKRRDATERPIIEGLEKCGFQVHQQDCPDLLLRRAGRVYLLEVDGITRNRKRSRTQLMFLAAWEIPIVKTLEQALKALGCGISGPAISVSCTSKHHSASTSSVAAR